SGGRSSFIGENHEGCRVPSPAARTPSQWAVYSVGLLSAKPSAGLVTPAPSLAPALTLAPTPTLLRSSRRVRVGARVGERAQQTIQPAGATCCRYCSIAATAWAV